MPAYPASSLQRVLARSLPSYVEMPTENSPKPAIFESSEKAEIAVYLWTVTPDRSTSGRPTGEHKSQIILPNTARGARQFFELRPTRPTFLLGWSPTFSVFVLWEVALHQGAAYSKNIQVREDLLVAASEQGWAVSEPRRLQRGMEVRCAVHPAHLERLLTASQNADERRLTGRARQVFFESSAPEFDLSARKFDPIELENVIQQRRMVTQQRLERSSKFAAQILPMYDYSCSICQIQLNAVEAAHIIPVHDNRSVDEPWNGIALCRNHHKLFDSRIVLIDRRLFVRTHQPTIELLHEVGRGNGLKSVVTPYVDKRVAIVPSEFESNSTFRAQMQAALDSVQLV